MAAVNGTMVFIPTNGSNVMQECQGMQGIMIQPPGTIQYVGQQFGSPSSQLQPIHRMGTWKKFLKVEIKTLWEIQIILGFIHIGLGGVSILLSNPKYLPLAAFVVYPIWSGIFFIFSGSLSVFTEKHLSFSMVKWTVGMNITSAIMALTGIIINTAELIINSYEGFYASDYKGIIIWSSGTGICVLLLLFSALELSITVLTTHIGCEACCNADTTTDFVPYPVAGIAPPAEVMILENSRGNADAAESYSPPPAYEENEVY